MLWTGRQQTGGFLRGLAPTLVFYVVLLPLFKLYVENKRMLAERGACIFGVVENNMNVWATEQLHDESAFCRPGLQPKVMCKVKLWKMSEDYTN